MTGWEKPGGWSAVGLPLPPGAPPRHPARASARGRTLVIILAVVTMGCWSVLGGALVLASVEWDLDESPPEAGALPDIPGVSFRPGDLGAWCGSGGCFATPVIGAPTDGARRSVVVDRIIRELLARGWLITEAEDDELSVQATSPGGVTARWQWTPETSKDLFTDSASYDLEREVEVVLAWTGGTVPRTNAGVPLSPGTAMGNLLLASVALSALTSMGLVTLVVAGRRSPGTR